MKISKLNSINNRSIIGAGPRYTPVIDKDAPNLKIQGLLDSVEALAVSYSSRQYIAEIGNLIKDAWNASSEKTDRLFRRGKSPTDIINLLKELEHARIEDSKLFTSAIRKAESQVSKVLNRRYEKLYEQRIIHEKDKKEFDSIEHERRIIRDLIEAIDEVNLFIRLPRFKLIINNRMFIKGEWGSGKTHSLCDITKERMENNRPTLFMLAHHLPNDINPLLGICQVTKIAKNPEELLNGLDKLGKKANQRALLIIDGINEGDKELWRKEVRKICSIVKKYTHVGLVLSCRTPFETQILGHSNKRLFVEYLHQGFQEIELSAQRVFFNYYGIPAPQLPLMTPEFSKPLFFKILCETFSGKTSSTKSRWINEIASGQRGMTKLLEDFAVHIGKEIEEGFDLQRKTCWLILKGNNECKGVASLMADNLSDYIEWDECLSAITEITNKPLEIVRNILDQMTASGLLSEDFIWSKGAERKIIRLPYQRFGDHLIARHLLSKHLDTSSIKGLRRSFYSNRPLGKVFKVDNRGGSYSMPGVASAVMLEFPERLKKMPADQNRELVYYLPKASRLTIPVIETFLEGILWRSKESFSKHTDQVFKKILEHKDVNYKTEALEALVVLGCRQNHPWSAQKLFDYLKDLSIVDRDLLWSEFLRRSYRESTCYRLLTWVEDSSDRTVDSATASNIMTMLSLFLTTTNRPLRDRATKALVLLGEKQSKSLFELAIVTLKFNDPYVAERMLAASYGVLMRSWSFPENQLRDAVSNFARQLYDNLYRTNAPFSTSHILYRDYSLGCIELARRIKKGCLGKRPLKNLRRSSQPPTTKIPVASKIKEGDCIDANHAIYMDFENYTIGSLVRDRRNYDNQHSDYKGVLLQIKWRILNLGYSYEAFKTVDNAIMGDAYRPRLEGTEGKVDRYGKKYSWIAFFEVAGMRNALGLLPDLDRSRLSDCDIDPSFPEELRIWNPQFKKLFKKPYESAASWLSADTVPNYNHLLQVEIVDNIEGPWVLIHGYMSESSTVDPRRTFTFINGVFIKPEDSNEIKNRFRRIKYPGNLSIPEPWKDHYTFAGEIPWSKKYGYDYFENRRDKRHIGLCLGWHEPIETPFEGISALISNKSSKGNTSSLLDMMQRPSYKSIPGIEVEIPVHSLSWESYHSVENHQTADFIAPSLCDFLELRNKGNSQDLFDIHGRPASLYRIFKENADYFKTTLLYLRRDLLQKYITDNQLSLIWLMWGERTLEYNELEKIRASAAISLDSNLNIHKRFRIYSKNLGK